MGIISRLIGRRCPYGCGAEAGFCRCGDGGAGDRKLTGRAKEVHGGRVVEGKPTGGNGAKPAPRKRG